MLRRNALGVVLFILLWCVPLAAAAPRKEPVAGRSPVITHVNTRKPYVALTVDDFFTGDYRRLAASHILEAANAARATLTLCPAGAALSAYSKLQPDQARTIQQLVAQGRYELCDHTYGHPVLPRLTMAAQEQEILAGQAEIQRFFGRPPSHLFRPPFGSWNVATQEAAFQAGYGKVITWSIDSGDSEGPEKSVQQLVANVACAGPGDIILMHANRRSSAEAMPRIIALLRAKGLEPVSLSTLLASGTPAYSYRPADMRRLMTCVHPPVKAPIGKPVPGVPAPPPGAVPSPAPAVPATPGVHRRNDPTAGA